MYGFCYGYAFISLGYISRNRISGLNGIVFSAHLRQVLWYLFLSISYFGLPGWCSGKEHAWQCRRHKRLRFDSWVGKITLRRKWQFTMVFLPGKFHGQRAWRATVHGVAESDMTEHVGMHAQLALFLYVSIYSCLLPVCESVIDFYILVLFSVTLLESPISSNCLYCGISGISVYRITINYIFLFSNICLLLIFPSLPVFN